MEPIASHVREVVRLADLVVASPSIRGHRFEDCLLLGPAVIATTGETVISHCTFDGEADELLWRVPPERKTIVGAIEAADCEFIRCRFSMIGFAGPDAFMEQFKRGLE